MSIQKAYIPIADGQVHYRHVPGEGTPVIFLHQTASSGRMWEAVMRRVGGGPLYAIDTPGFGGSFDPAVQPDIGQYAAWMVQVLDALDLDQAHVVGHHTGAAIGLQMAIDAPQRVASLVMVGPNPLTADERDAMAKRFGRPFKPARSGAYLLQNWEYLRVGGADRHIDLLHAEMIDMLRAWAARPHAYEAVWRQDFAALYQRLARPALIMSAPDDVLYPFFQRAQEMRPDIDAVLLSGGANFEADLVPGELAAALVSFWEKVGGG